MQSLFLRRYRNNFKNDSLLQHLSLLRQHNSLQCLIGKPELQGAKSLHHQLQPGGGNLLDGALLVESFVEMKISWIKIVLEAVCMCVYVYIYIYILYI